MTQSSTASQSPREGRIRCAIIGSGNIGTDLLYKLRRHRRLEPAWMVGIDPASEGLVRAAQMGLKTTFEGVAGLLPHLDDDEVRIAFDATSAAVHLDNWRQLCERDIRVIDLTPAAVGPPCIPTVNLEARARAGERNVNMVSCGAQATVPIVAAISRVQPVEYGEIVATVASRSIGPGTRQNIDEFTRTTARAIESLGGAERGKAIIVINPAEPPITMRDTIHCMTVAPPRTTELEASVRAMVEEVQAFVPGYRIKNGPVFDGRRVTVWMEVQGLGDYLPTYAGNLDIMTAAAVRTAEQLAGGPS